MKSNLSLVQAAQLSDEQGHQADELVEACRRFDGLDIDLYLEPASPLSENRTNQILCFDDKRLAGIAALSGDMGIEVQMVVHPEYRRRGIGTALIDAARDEARRRESPHLLLVCDAASAPGKAFVRALKAGHAYSEYRMQMDPAAIPAADPRETPPEDRILLQPVSAELPETLIHLCVEGNEHPIEAVRQRITTWLVEPNQRLYVGTRPDGSAVGMLRVATFEIDIYINTFSVLPALRGRGYGRQMLAQIVRTLSNEPKPVRLEVETQNRNALSLYISCGFQILTEYQYHALPT